MKLDAPNLRAGGAAASPSRQPALDDLWSAYRTDGGVTCFRCERRAPLVASVSYAPRGYQLTCSRCGWGTPWFDWQDGAIALVGLDRFGRGSEQGGRR